MDNGTVGKYGAELALRRKLEKFISTQSLGGSQGKIILSEYLVFIINISRQNNGHKSFKTLVKFFIFSFSKK